MKVACRADGTDHFFCLLQMVCSINHQQPLSRWSVGLSQPESDVFGSEGRRGLSPHSLDNIFPPRVRSDSSV